MKVLFVCRESFGYPLSSVAGKEMIREREEKAESSPMFDPFNRNEEYASHVYEGCWNKRMTEAAIC